MESMCNNLKLQIQALADGELDNNKEVTTIFEHLSTCESCRNNYLSIINLDKKLKTKNTFIPSDDWIAKLEKKKSNKIIRRLGYSLIIIPYILLIIAGVWELFNNGSESLLTKVLIAGILTGFLLLLIYTIKGRIHESKTDKYKEIVR